VPIQTNPTVHNSHYLDTKRDKMGHLFAGAPATVPVVP
jgi:GTP cyclohydrolase II